MLDGLRCEGLMSIMNRHEYLGPDPKVAGYRVDVDGEFHIRWWDSFLHILWMDGGKWSFDVRQTENGKWVDADD